MKHFFTLAIILLFISSASAQTGNVRITIDTTVYDAVQFLSDLSDDEARDAIEGYFDNLHIEKEKGKGFIIKKSLGYMLFKRAKVEGSNDNYDYYFVVDPRRQKGKDGSTISIAVGKDVGSFYSPGNSGVWNTLTQFADYLQSNYFEQHKLYVKLSDTNKDMDKKMKKLQDVLKEKSELESNISKDSLQISNLNDALLKLKTKQ
ncbi:hypothetical protein [Parafilimonas sp.]|uniref:hypothetical protein n=1 Tax=Parafilimonas sp. TaxID=1969739 RepID=UPI0039E32B82